MANGNPFQLVDDSTAKRVKFVGDSVAGAQKEMRGMGQSPQSIKDSTKDLQDLATRQVAPMTDAAVGQALSPSKITTRGPSMHSGGVVEKDGPHDLQKGERVLSKDDTANLESIFSPDKSGTYSIHDVPAQDR